ncbi:MAG: molybdopterin-synthase adenylyltransferase MoeB [Fibromonadales bacterium]|nr:molybdopterin-synthase adenylyltransferase MoeB [Fibromonadales bacterium]
MLLPEEISRYSRHLLLSEIGVEGQEKLKNAKVLIVGAGGLGSPAAMYLAAAGVGTIGIADFDQADLSNLQRQIAYTTKDIGKQKSEVISMRLKEMNPLVNIITYNAALTSKNALDILKDYQIAVDCSDNFQTRYLLNDSCVLLGKPYVYGSVSELKGQASVFYAKEGPCYRCLYPEPAPLALKSCMTSGLLGVLPGVIGCIMANEVLKLIIGKQNVQQKQLTGRLLLFNAWDASFDELKISKDENCPMCGKDPSIKELIDYEEFCGLKKDGNTCFNLANHSL